MSHLVLRFGLNRESSVEDLVVDPMSGNHPQLDYWPPAPGGAPGGALGATQPNPVAAPLHGQNVSNSPHGEPDSPFYPPLSTFMPPEDSPFSTALPSPAISSQVPAMYPQVMILGLVSPYRANRFPYRSLTRLETNRWVEQP